jgi:3-methyladenine DNA glycosylase AlkD
MENRSRQRLPRLRLREECEVTGVAQIVAELESMASQVNRAGMARFGINTERALGISVANLRRIARKCGRSHELALQLWATGIHEARILACLVDVPSQVTARQMDQWAAAFNPWDLCDQCCANLFDRTPFAWKKTAQWSRRKPEFVRRAGFSLVAALARHDKSSPDRQFLAFLPVIEKYAGDPRNFVRIAVNWALRETGKRNPALRGAAIDCAMRILEQGTPCARWIARDALRDLQHKST